MDQVDLKNKKYPTLVGGRNVGSGITPSCPSGRRRLANQSDLSGSSDSFTVGAVSAGERFSIPVAFGTTFKVQRDSSAFELLNGVVAEVFPDVLI